MAFPFEIQTALLAYDEQKSYFRQYIWEHPAISALRQMSEESQAELSQILSCFLTNKPSEFDLAAQVYRSALTLIPDFEITDLEYVFDKLYKAGLFNQENFNQLLDPIHHYLCTKEAVNQVWSALPPNLLTQSVFQELLKNMTKQDNPADALRPYLSRLLILKETQGLTDRQRLALEMHRQRMRDGDLVMEIRDVYEAMGVDVLIEDNPNATKGVINPAESTHTVSVHQSVSKSAKLLMARYGKNLDEARVEAAIAKMTNQVFELKDNALKNQAANRCINNLTSSKYHFKDPESNISTRLLLALVYLAMHEDNPFILQGGVDNAWELFIDGLYEMQRGENLTETGFDLGGPDDLICEGGVFNKLIEKLAGVHQDCNIIYITQTTAALKLPVVVREEAMRYLSSRACPQTIEAFIYFTHLIGKLNQQSVELIWEEIQPAITERMFNEFGSAYLGRPAHLFTEMVDTGKEIELNSLSRFKWDLLCSPGYHQYCSRAIYRSIGFFNRQQPEPSMHSDDHICKITCP